MSDASLPVIEGLIDAWNRRDLDDVLARMHPDCEVRPIEANETLRGHDGVAVAFRDWFDAFESFRLDTEDVVERGDRVLVSTLQRARGKGSGIEVEERFYQLFTMRDGRIFRFEEYSDEAEARRALGE